MAHYGPRPMDRLPDEISLLEQRALQCAVGELPPDDAAAFEQEAAHTLEARAALEEARDLLRETAAGLAELQKAEVVSEQAMRRARNRAGKAIFAWVEVEREAQVLRAIRRHPLAEGMVWRYTRWPLAAAALLVVGLVIWTFSTEPAQNRNFAESRPVIPLPGQADSTSGNGLGEGSVAPSAGELDQIAALFDNPSRDGSERILAGGLSNELAALRLLEEADYE